MAEGGNMDTSNSVERTVSEETKPPFRIKDLMMGELLCQAGIVSDGQLLEMAALARSIKGSLGSALVLSSILSPSQLFASRRIVNRYVNDSENADRYIRDLFQLVEKGRKAPTRDTGSIGLAKITRRYMTTNEALFLVS